jgi:hypothetical protein
VTGNSDPKAGTLVEHAHLGDNAAAVETLDALRQRIEQLEAENAAMRPIVVRMAEARMCLDATAMIESCPHCSLKRGGAYGYTGKHDPTCVVSMARALGY